MKIIGLTGYKGSGKNLAASYIITNYPGWKDDSFAAPIRKMLSTMGFPLEYLYGKKEEVIPELGVTGRHLLQTLGTEWGRNMVGHNLWVQLASMRMKTAKSDVVFTDLRFPNESLAVWGAGGIVVRIVRPGHDGDDHSSEKSMAQIVPDHTITNNCDLEHLEKQIRFVIDNYETIKEGCPHEL
jgi:hypothetical protein